MYSFNQIFTEYTLHAKHWEYGSKQSEQNKSNSFFVASLVCSVYYMPNIVLST